MFGTGTKIKIITKINAADKSVRFTQSWYESACEKSVEMRQ